MPAWVDTGFNEYAKRLPASCRLVLQELPLAPRGKNYAISKVMAREEEAIKAVLTDKQHCLALDVNGDPWSTEQLAKQLAYWQSLGQDVALLVGGPDGLAETLKQQAKQRWSLSPLTFPHPLVRVIVAEQLYRAWSLLNHHPYHRA